MNKVSIILVAVLGLLVGGLVGSYFMSSAIDSKSQENKQVVRYKVGYAGGEVPEIWNVGSASEPQLESRTYLSDISLKSALLWVASPGYASDPSSPYFDAGNQYQYDLGICFQGGGCDGGIGFIEVYGTSITELDRYTTELKKDKGYKFTSGSTSFHDFEKSEFVDKETKFGGACVYYIYSAGNIGFIISFDDCSEPSNLETVQRFINTFDIKSLDLAPGILPWSE